MQAVLHTLVLFLIAEKLANVKAIAAQVFAPKQAAFALAA